VTVVAAGFDKVAPAAAGGNQFESRLSRLLEEPVRTEGEEGPGSLPSILVDETDEEADVFITGEQEPQPSVSFDAEEDLDIPDFLKS
jgi:hypothetical protein